MQRQWCDIETLVYGSKELVRNTHEDMNVCTDKLRQALRDKRVSPDDMVRMLVVFIFDKLSAEKGE